MIVNLHIRLIEAVERIAASMEASNEMSATTQEALTNALKNQAELIELQKAHINQISNNQS